MNKIDEHINGYILDKLKQLSKATDIPLEVLKKELQKIYTEKENEKEFISYNPLMPHSTTNIIMLQTNIALSEVVRNHENEISKEKIE